MGSGTQHNATTKQQPQPVGEQSEEIPSYDDQVGSRSWFCISSEAVTDKTSLTIIRSLRWATMIQRARPWLYFILQLFMFVVVGSGGLFMYFTFVLIFI